MAVARILYRGPHFRLGSFECPLGDARWRELNDIGPAAHVVFPHTNVVISQLARSPLLATPNHVVFYNAGQRYRREPRHADGDRSFYVEVDPPLLAELVPPRRRAEFPFAEGPSDAGSYLLHHQLFRVVGGHGDADPLFVDETAHILLERAAGRAFGMRSERPRQIRRVLVEHAKELLAERATARVSLAELGRALHCSPFHLARVFRAETGFTLHSYRNQLRLRVALERLESASDLASLARELGYSSHSHFTDAFRRAFGISPSLARSGRELSTILEAAR